jgi:hypothetical protein
MLVQLYYWNCSDDPGPHVGQPSPNWCSDLLHKTRNTLPLGLSCSHNSFPSFPLDSSTFSIPPPSEIIFATVYFRLSLGSPSSSVRSIPFLYINMISPSALPFYPDLRFSLALKYQKNVYQTIRCHIPEADHVQRISKFSNWIPCLRQLLYFRSVTK